MAFYSGAAVAALVLDAGASKTKQNAEEWFLEQMDLRDEYERNIGYRQIGGNAVAGSSKKNRLKQELLLSQTQFNLLRFEEGRRLCR